MTLYNIERLFGRLSLPPQDVYTRGADEIIDELKERVSGPSPAEEDIVKLFDFALRFTRPDGLTSDLSDTPMMGECLLQRARLRFYLILSDKPDNPDHNLLEAVLNDYTMAAISPEAEAEALAGVIRLRIIMGDRAAALKDLGRLTRERSEAFRRAAAAVLLFLAEQPGTPAAERRRLLRRSYRLFGKAGDEYADLIRAEIMVNMGQPENARFILAKRAAAGSLDAEIALLKMEVRLAEFKYNPPLLRPLWERIKKYCRERPWDPNGYIAQGDIFFDYDPEAARSSYMQALFKDKRCSEAWFLLGELDRTECEKLMNREVLDRAIDAYRSSITLDPLSLRARIELGRLEREISRQDLAINTLKAALSLVPENLEARRRLALCWCDLFVSKSLDDDTRRAAACQARSEWEIIIRQDAKATDYFSLIRSCLNAESDHPNYSHLISKLLSSKPPMKPEQLVDLAASFIYRERFTQAARLLDAAESSGAEGPRLMAYRAAVLARSDRAKGAELYLKAAADRDITRDEYVEWTVTGALMVNQRERTESILKKALKRFPGEQTLLDCLCRLMEKWERPDEAIALYEKALKDFPEDRGILEDAVWLFGRAKRSDLAEHCIRDALKRSPDDARLWNQLGVHFMERGWDADHEELDPEYLKKAVEAYRRAVEAEPEGQAHWANLGDSLRHSGKWKEAVEALKKAGDLPFALNSLARLEDQRSYDEEDMELSASNWESAGEHYRAAADGAAGNPEYDRDCAWWLYRESSPGEAVKYYSRASAALPEDRELAYGEYQCRSALGEESEAMEALERALSCDPENTQMLADKADLLASMGEVKQAVGIFNRLLERDEDKERTWRRVAEFRERQLFPENDGGLTIPRFHVDSPPSLGEDFLTGLSRPDPRGSAHKEALEAWEKAVSLQSDDKTVRGRLGLALMYNGRIEESRRVLEESLIRGGAWQDAPLLRALARMDIAASDAEGSSAAAVQRLELALEIFPNAGLFWSDLGLCYAVDGLWTKCFEACASAADREPENSVMLANAGIAALCSDKAEAAVDFLRRALEIDSSDAEWENALGLAHLAAGDHSEAVEAFRAACLNDPQNQEYSANLAMACKSFNIPNEIIQ